INTPVQALAHTVAFLQEAFEDVLGLYDAVKAGAAPGPAEQAADLDYLRERVPAAFARAAEGVDRVATIVRTMGERSHPAARAPADLNAVARAALALAGGSPDFQSLPTVTCDA